jgi:phosphomannomutase
MMTSAAPGSLRAALDHEPVPLRFGTSGRRGLVADLTQLEVCLNATAELEYLLALPVAEGGIVRGDDFYIAADLRPSSTAVVDDPPHRGGIAQAIARAVRDAGLHPVYLGRIPTPALAAFALARGRGSIMVTGSHIPFDRNGYKVYTSRGELLKKDEAPIQERVEAVRARLYAQPAAESPFDAHGMLKVAEPLPPEDGRASRDYADRYAEFFDGRPLSGRRLLVWQHSAVGRDLLVDILCRLGATVVPAGRSDAFVPVDTEAIDDAQLRAVQALLDAAWSPNDPFDAVVSTDGDSDRPLLLGVEPAPGGGSGPGRLRFFGGDLVGMVVAEFLGADAVVVPVSCNDAVDRGALKDVVEPKTRIGSPYVIAGMEAARARGRKAVCGWEANGGFLTGTDMTRGGRVLKALPTRDAVLPIVAVLAAAAERGGPVRVVFDRLPRRFSRAALLRNFPRETARRIVARLSPADARVRAVDFAGGGATPFDAAGLAVPPDASTTAALESARAELARVFSPERGFAAVARIDTTDGVRVHFADGDVAHVRPSGNADELRIYAVAGTQARADAIAAMGVAEPDGLLRQLERAAHDDEIDMAIGRFRTRPGLVPLRGVVQHYHWGGFDFIPSLLGQSVPSERPCAELWLGAHPGGPSVARIGDTELPLQRLLERAPAEALGPAVAARAGGTLPYLLKVLDAREMLSIQAHPDRRQAEEGFDRETAAGMAPGSPSRNYKDRNPKPEVHVALTDFSMLHGFRPLEEIAGVLDALPELQPLMPNLRARLARAGSDGPARAALLRDLYAAAMTMPQDAADRLLGPLMDRLRRGPSPERDDPAFWALRACEQFPPRDGRFDRGLFSIFLLNLVRLKPGQGTFQPAGTLHAYLEGVTVELMAGSDNVLRGGLTPKRVDVPNLMRILRFDGGRPAVLEGIARDAVETVYPTSAESFELSRLDLAPGREHRCGAGHGPHLLLVTSGAATARSGDGAFALNRGDVALAPHAAAYALEATNGPAQVFKAACPS